VTLLSKMVVFHFHLFVEVTGFLVAANMDKQHKQYIW